MSGFRVVIPARFGSSRLPGKVLRPLAGKPMLEHVWLRACASRAMEVLIATDDEAVAAIARGFGAAVVMTRKEHQSGTDRIHEVALARNWAENSIVVNLQGDEPGMPPALIRQVAIALAERPEADIATLCFPLTNYDDWQSPHLVKVVRADDGNALYFSRAPIPYPRASALEGNAELPPAGAFGHLGLYAYRVGALKRFSQLPPAALEQCESLEQLRALANGLRVHVPLACAAPGPGVDTEEDLQRAEAFLQATTI